MKIFEVTELREDAVSDALAKARRAIALGTENTPDVTTTAPTAPTTPGAGDNADVQTGSGTDQRPNTATPGGLATPAVPGSASVDSDPVARQAQAQQAWTDRYPADTFVQGMPSEYYQAVEELSGNLNPQNVQRLEDVVQNDTPNEIVQVLYRRLTSNQGYSKEDLQAAVDEGTAGGFSQAEVDGATQLLDYLRRLEIRMNQ